MILRHDIQGKGTYLGVEDLLRQLRHADGAEGVGAAGCERGEADHEEVQTWERHHVDSELAQIAVELAREAQAGGHARHDGRDEMIQITVTGLVQLQRAHANVVQGLVVNAECLVRVLHQLVDRQCRVIRLDHRIADLGRRHDREGRHHAVGKLFADLADEQCAHAGAGAAAERVRDLEALQAVAAFGFTAHDVENLVDQLGALGVVALGPIVARARLPEDEVVRTEELAKGSRAHGIHGAGFEVDEHGTGDVFVARCLPGVSVSREHISVFRGGGEDIPH